MNFSQEVLKKAGVFHKYFEFSRVGSDIMKFYRHDKDKPDYVMTIPKTLHWLVPPAPESNRQLLREALIESAEENVTIQFNCSITEIVQNNNQAELFGTIDRENEIISLGIFDLVVDASGFGSKLRNYRIDEDEETRFNSYYTGITMCHGLINNPDAVCDPKILEKLGEGSMMSFDTGVGFGLQRYGASADDKRTSFYYSIPLKDISTLSEKFNLPKKTIFHEDKETLDKVKKWLYEELTFHKFPKEYFSAVDNIDAVSIRPLMQHPPNPAFRDSNLPLILIGDALHALPPYTGSGGNLALDDASDLSEYIIKNNGAIDLKDLRVLEAKFLKRAVPIMNRGNKTKKFIIETDVEFRNGETTGNGFRRIGLILVIAASILTYIYYLECFLGIRKDNKRS